MTTATQTAIVPAMSLGTAPVRTGEDSRTVPLVPLEDRTVPQEDRGTGPAHLRTVPPVPPEQDRPTEDRAAPEPEPTPDRTGPVPAQDRPDPGPDRNGSGPGPAHPRIGPDPITAGPDTPPVRSGTGPDHEEPTEDRTGPDRSKAGQIRRVFDEIYDPSTEQIHAWLDEHDVHASPRYIRRVIREERDRRNLTETGDMPALNADVLARMDAERDDTDTRIRVADEPAGTVRPMPKPVPVPESPASDEQQATAELAARVREARARLPLQADPSLLTALSDEEIKAERDLAEWERATDREIRRAAKKAELANARRAQDTATALAKADSDDARWHQRALSMRRRLTSPDARLAQLYRRAEWSSRALITVMLLAMAWSGVNVQHNLVPDGDMSKMLYWLSYGLEATISVPLIVIMIAATTAARWGRQLSRKKVIPIELTLLAVTVGLNAGPHLFSDPSKAAEYAIAPIMVGAVVWLHAWISQHYATLIEGSNVIGVQQ